MELHLDSGLVYGLRKERLPFTLDTLSEPISIVKSVSANDVKIALLVHTSRAPRRAKPSLLQFI